MEIELFKIIKRELISKKKNDKRYTYSEVAVINTLQKAIDLTETLNYEKKNENVIYFYENK